ncbi:MAG: dolichol monophosphate mannose synthase, partial [Christensenella minuta]|nr:dolichol monophosphate mannose synthase [Christensenella minuta]MDY3752233.1 dolichol monophosphate mannose synthase [Christensenella minuta]
MKFGTYFAYWEREWDADYASYCEKAAGLGFDVLEVAAGG